MKREMAVTWGNIGLVSQKMGRLEEAVESFRMQHSLADEIGEKLILLSSYGSLSSIYSSLGMLDDAWDTAQMYLRQARELPAMQDMLLASNLLGILNLAKGRIPEARERAEEVLDMPGSESYERERTSSLFLLGMVRMEEGDSAGALEAYRRAEIMARELHSKSLLVSILSAMIHHGTAASAASNLDAMLEEAEGLVREMGAVTWTGRISLLRGRAHLLDGRRDDSIAETDRAIAVFEEYGLRPALAEALEFRCSFFHSEGSAGQDDPALEKEIRERLDRLLFEMGIEAGRISPILIII
jgi:tetratricopeptide (TPR) repeat protein